MNSKVNTLHNNLIVLGCQWGDEGKAKIVDILAPYFDIIGRYQGGGNAGHTVIVNGEKVIFHLVPTGILHENKQVILGNGMVIYPPSFVEELENIKSKGINCDNRIHISSRAHVVMPYHLLWEKHDEERRNKVKIGTTMRGIGPAYADKISRCGIIVADLLDEERLRKKLEAILDVKNSVFRKIFQVEGISVDQVIDEYSPIIPQIQPFVCDCSYWLNHELDKGKTLLCEGAQGTHLDIDHGTYPYVTSSNSSAGGAVTGLGVGPARFNHVLGITKAYVTRVGSGPFPSEDLGPDGRKMQETGKEYGSTTGRPRRCGWIDIPSLRYSARVNGLSAFALTKLDVLSGLKTIKICHKYKIGKTVYDEFPEDPSQIESCKPVYIEVDGWKENISMIKKENELPNEAQQYITMLENLLGVEIAFVSVGPEREKFFLREKSAFFNHFPALLQRKTY